MKKIITGLLSLVLCSCAPTNLQTLKIETLAPETVQTKVVEENNNQNDKIVKDYLEKKVELLKKQSDYLERCYREGIREFELGFVETKMNLVYFETALKVVGKETNLYSKVYKELEKRHWLFPTEDKELRKEQVDKMIKGVKGFEGYAEMKYKLGLSDVTDLLRIQSYLLDLEFMLTKYN